MPTDPLTTSRYPSASAAPNVNQDIQNAVLDLADNTYAGPFATTTARNTAFTAWVAAGNAMRDGLHCHVTGVGDQVYLSGAWRTASSGVTSGRYWNIPRTGNASDTPPYTADTYVSVHTGTVSNAPEGGFLVTSRLVISNTANITGYQRLVVNSVTVGSDPRADTIGTSRMVFVQTVGVTHPGGNLNLIAYYRAASGSPTVWSQGTEFTVAYLGPS